MVWWVGRVCEVSLEVPVRLAFQCVRANRLG